MSSSAELVWHTHPMMVMVSASFSAETRYAMGLKMPEILLILVALLLLFGATRLPQLGSSLGSAIRNFKRGFGGEGEDTPPTNQGKGGNTSLSSSTTVETKDLVAQKES